MSERTIFILENFPEDTYTRDPDSNLYKLLNAFSIELDAFLDKVEDIRSAKFLDESWGEHLDKIAKLIGIYRFFGESDNDFRTRIRARVPSFIGGGTIQSIEGIILEFLRVEATVIEHHKPNNGFASFHNGVIFGMKCSVSNENGSLFLDIGGGTAYINGSRFFKEPETIEVEYGNIGDSKYLFLNSNGDYIVRSSINKSSSEILLYRIFFDGVYSATLENLKFQLDPTIHNITNTATISIQIPYDVDESILSIEEINNIIMSTKAAGVAVLIRIIDTIKETITIDSLNYPYFLTGFSFLGSQDKIGYDRQFKRLSKVDGTLAPYKNYTFRQIGASSKGYQKYGGL